VIPGEWLLSEEPVEINAGRRTLRISVRNTGDRPIQVGSHYHLGFDVPDEWVFEDEGHSGATLVRPALEGCVTWSSGSASTWCCATRRTGWPASSPIRPC
jgi:urease beta subunit